MATFVVGTPKPKMLGIVIPQPAKPVIPAGTQFFVVPYGNKLVMQGYSANKSKTGKITVYAVFDNYDKAHAYCHGKTKRVNGACVVPF